MKQEVRNTFERILKGDEAGACRLYEMARQGDGEAIYAFVCAMYSADLDRRILNKPLQQRADFIHETTFEQSVRAVNEYFSLLRQYMNPYKAMSKLRTGMAEETLIGTLLLFGYGVEKDEYNGLRFFVRSCEGLVDTVYTNNVKILYNTPQYRNKISLFIERLSWGNKEWIGYDGRFTRNSEYNYDTTEFRFAIYQC
ncbi:MAG: hypothetical protein LBR17_05655, partial [Bacteroidales bacterium]|nr:hypothetical protein [Bacteroidales bacterium]